MIERGFRPDHRPCSHRDVSLRSCSASRNDRDPQGPRRRTPPMFDLKPLNPLAISRALQRADRYRLLNEPEEAESICLDILLVAHDHPEALITLLLALSDQFRTDYDTRLYTQAKE